MNVLLVDDEPVICKSVGDFLNRLGYGVATARSGEDAQCLLAGADLDVVISDVRMSGISGLELLTWVRQKYPEMHVVLITGHGDSHMAREATEKGASGFLHKPLKLVELVHVLDRIA